MILRAGSFSYTFLDQRKLDKLHNHQHNALKEMDQASSFGEPINGQMIRATFLGSNVGSIPVPFGESLDYYNYFLGNDEAKWSADVRSYQGVRYPAFYSGIDLKVYSQGENLKYDFVVAPGVDLSQIQFNYSGADQVYLKNGNLIIHTALLDIIEQQPIIYQIISGKKIFVKGSYELSDGQISFCLDEPYDPCFELVIDPLLIFSTYSGFSADNWGSSATPGERGTLYSAGVTNLYINGSSFPATPGSFQTSYGGIWDVALYKYDSTGTQLLYTSFLGGGNSESPHSLVMTENEELLILGTTSSTDFPASANAYDKTFNGGVIENNVIPYTNGADIFISKVSKDGRLLLASTLIGGSKNDGLNPSNSALVRNYGDELRGDIISDEAGNIFVSTVTASSDFPVVNGFDTSYNGGVTDGVIMKMSPDLSTILWASFLGGSLADASHTIQIDRMGDLFVGGGSNSADFPITTGSYQTTNAGNGDGWIAKLKGDGSVIMRSTFTGTPLFNQVYFLDLDQQENVYVYGQTQGSFPTTPNVYKNANSGQFLQKFDNSLSTLIFSTVFGSGIGIPNISPTAFLVNDCNNIYLSGWGGFINSAQGFWQSSTAGMVVTPDAFQPTTSGSDFYLMVLNADATQLLYATFLGGSSSRTHLDGGTCRFDKGGVVYHAVCAGCAAANVSGFSTSDFPATSNAWSRTNGSANCNNAAFKFDLFSLKAKLQTNNKLLTSPGLNQICIADTILFQNQSIGGQIFFWDFGDGTKATKLDRTTILHRYKLPGTYKVKLKAVDQGTCIGKDSTQTTLLVFNPTGFADPDLLMCYNAGTQLVAGGGVTYLWTTFDKSFSSNQPNVVVNPKVSVTYFISIADINGCTKNDTVNLRVVPNIDLKFTAERVNYDCFDRPSLKVSSQTDPTETVFFDFGDGTTSDLQSTVHNYTRDGDFAVRLIGKKEVCTYESEISVPIFELKIPNVFTPDQSPGFNDTFQIAYGGQTILQAGISTSIVIYNRWGGKVFESKDYKGDWTANDLPSGVYYYDIQIMNETSCKGWVQVIR